jgi:ABC-2 type transport system ATP-binding protein
MLEVTGLIVGDAKAAPLIDDVTFAIREGEWYTIVGPPGAGKSVLVEALLGARRITSGSVRMAGIDVAREPLRARGHVTYVSGTGALLPTLSLWRNARWLLQLVGVRACTRRTIERALREAEIPDAHLATPAQSVPASERLGVWLAIAALRKSAILLLDDPARDLSARASDQLAWLLDDRRRQGTSILLTTRDAMFGAAVPHHIGLLQSGRIVAESVHVPEAARNLRALVGQTTGPVTAPPAAAR